MLALSNPSFQPKTQRWRPGAGGGPSGEVPSQNCAFCAPKQPFLAQNGTENPLITAKRRETVAIVHVRLGCPMTKSPLLCSNSMICPRNGPKVARMCAVCVKQARNQERAVSWAMWLKIRFRGHLSHTQPPTFCGLQASDSPNETRRPPFQWSPGQTEGTPARAWLGPTMGPPGYPGRKRRFFSKLFLNHLGCSNKCLFRPFGARGGMFWAIENPKMP